MTATSSLPNLQLPKPNDRYVAIVALVTIGFHRRWPSPTRCRPTTQVPPPISETVFRKLMDNRRRRGTRGSRKHISKLEGGHGVVLGEAGSAFGSTATGCWMWDCCFLFLSVFSLPVFSEGHSARPASQPVAQLIASAGAEVLYCRWI